MNIKTKFLFFIISTLCTGCLSFTFTTANPTIQTTTETTTFHYDTYCMLYRPCLNGGTCFDQPNWSGSFYCACPLGFTGTHCDQEDCNTSPPTTTYPALTTVQNPISHTYCDIFRPCQNGGTCFANPFDLHNSFYCLCPQGLTGQKCEISNTTTESYTMFTSMLTRRRAKNPFE